jgi:hypothetical protein
MWNEADYYQNHAGHDVVSDLQQRLLFIRVVGCPMKIVEKVTESVVHGLFARLQLRFRRLVVEIFDDFLHGFHYIVVIAITRCR